MVEVNKTASGRIACSCCGKVLDNRAYHFCPWCGTRQTQNDGKENVASAVRSASILFFPEDERGYFCPFCRTYTTLDTAFRCERCGLDFFAPTGDNTVYMEDDN